jgi:hypothetical protein
MAKINVLDQQITVQTRDDADYICLTDIARYKDAERTDDLIRNWLRNRNTVEFLGLWEQLNNPGFKPVEFDGFGIQAGLNSFTLTPKQRIEKTGAVEVKTSGPLATEPRNERGLCRATAPVLSSIDRWMSESSWTQMYSSPPCSVPAVAVGRCYAYACSGNARL